MLRHIPEDRTFKFSLILFYTLVPGIFAIGFILAIENLGETTLRRPVIKVICEEYYLLKYDAV
jgi:hypothetical protein